jgi:hypothetical protein
VRVVDATAYETDEVYEVVPEVMEGVSDPPLRPRLERVVSPDATAGEAGVTIEKRDMSDLDRAIASNPSADTSRGLENLGAGSTRHLAAFERVVAGDTSVGTGSGSMGPNVGQGQGQGMGRGSGPGTGMGAML